jgi:hypothetical protein
VLETKRKGIVRAIFLQAYSPKKGAAKYEKEKIKVLRKKNLA